MIVTNSASGTTLCEVGDGIFRISTPVPADSIDVPGGFTFNQYLVLDDEPLLFHTGMKSLFPHVREAIARVLPVETIRWLAFSHFEADECGALNELLAAAPRAQPLCGELAAELSIGDFAARPPRTIGDGEEITTGRRRMRFFAAPHLPHNWECGYLFDETSRTLFCGDLLTQPGASGPAVVEDPGVVESVAELEVQMGAFAKTGAVARRQLEGFAELRPELLASMHGSAFRGDGEKALRELATALGF